MRLFQPTYTYRGAAKRTATWSVEFRDHMGTVRRLAVSRDRRLAQRWADHLERLLAHRAAGEPPPAELVRWLASLPDRLVARLAEWDILRPSSAAGLAPLDQHITAWAAALRAKGTGHRHIQTLERRVRDVFAVAGAIRWSDVATDRVQQAITRLGDERNSSARTRRAWVEAVRQFERWAVLEGRVASTPLERLVKPRPMPVRRRRALTPAEVQRLLRAAPPERALLYRLALESGLRVNELRRLRVADLDLDGPHPALRVRAQHAKNRRDATLPLRASLAAALREAIADRLPSAEVVRVSDKPASMLRRDLEAAGVEVEDASGRRVDFHALRHTFITALARSGAPVHVTQRLARHATPNLTLAVYTHVQDADLRDALDALPETTRPPADQAAENA